MVMSSSRSLWQGFFLSCRLFLVTDVSKRFLPGLSSYSQKHLVESLLKKTYAAYDTIEDVKALEELGKVSNIPSNVMEKVPFSVAYVRDNNLQSNIRKRFEKSQRS